MTMKFDKESQTYIVSYSKRPPGGGAPKNLRRKGIKSRAKAEKVEQELIGLIYQKIAEIKAPKYGKVLEEYLDYCYSKGLAEGTINNRRLCLGAYTLDEWGGRLVDTFDSIEIRRLIEEKTSHRSPSQQKNILRYIRGFFDYCVERAYISKKPAPVMKFRAGDKIKKVLTVQQANKLLRHAKEMNCVWYPLWAAALYTGMRNSELFPLLWEDVNLSERSIWVNKSWTKKGGLKDHTKSNDDRIVEIAPPLVKVLSELKDEYFSESAYVFPIKVMAMGGWKDIKTMQIYLRKAGINIKGMTDNLSFE